MEVRQKKYFYMGKKEAIAFQSMLFAICEERIPNYVEVFGENCIEYYGYDFPNYVTIEDDGTVREANNYELYLHGIIELPSDMYITKDTHEVRSKFETFPYGHGVMIKPEWSDEIEGWYESATIEEQVEFRYNEKMENIDTMLSETDKFDLLTYRQFVSSKGDNLSEMDAYRAELIGVRYQLGMVNIKKVKSLDFIQTISQLPERPSWSFKY